MAAVPLTRNQTQSAVIAGAVAHTIFQAGWFAFGMSVAALAASALFGGLVSAISNALGGAEASNILAAIGAGSELLLWIVISFVIGSLILIGMSILLSGWMLSAAGMHRPWRTTMAAVGIAALVDIALFWIYIGISNLLTNSPIAGPVLLTPVIALVGGIVVGSLIWWLMALANRERAAAPAGQTPAVASSSTPAVLGTSAESIESASSSPKKPSASKTAPADAAAEPVEAPAPAADKKKR